MRCAAVVDFEVDIVAVAGTAGKLADFDLERLYL